jgi:hypothetical protein
MIAILAVAFGVALAVMPPASDCSMRPPPLNVDHIRTASEVKSVVVDQNELAATALLNDGSVLRVTNMGCQHSGSIVRLWVIGQPPSTTETQVWIAKAKLAADIGFDPVEAKFFDKWLATAKIKPQEEGGLTADGSFGEGDITYEVIVSPRDMDVGTLVTVSYAYP